MYRADPTPHRRIYRRIWRLWYCLALSSILGIVAIASPASAQDEAGNYACLHIFGRTESDQEYNIITGESRTVPRLPGISDNILISPDGKWFSLEGEEKTETIYGSSDATSVGSRWKYRASLYVGMTTNGEVLLTENQSPGYLDQEVALRSTSWSPDSQYLAYLDAVDKTGSSVLVIYDLKTGQKITSSPENPLHQYSYLLGWSADGKYLAIATYPESDEQGLVIFSSSTLAPYFMPGEMVGESDTFLMWSDFTPAFAWSPDGHRFAYIRRGDSPDQYQLVVAVPNETPLTLVVANSQAFAFTGIAWSPDGNHVVIEYDGANFQERIKVVRLGDDSLLSVFEKEVSGWVSWSKDGQSLLLLSKLRAKVDLMVYEIATDSLRTLVENVETWDVSSAESMFPLNLAPHAEHLLIAYILAGGKTGLDLLNMSDFSHRTLYQSEGKVKFEWSPNQQDALISWITEAHTPTTKVPLVWVSIDDQEVRTLQIDGFTRDKVFVRGSSEYGVKNLGWVDGGQKLVIASPLMKGEVVEWQVALHSGRGEPVILATGLHDVSLSTKDLESDVIQFTWRDNQERQYIDQYTVDGQRILRLVMGDPLTGADMLESPYYLRRSPAGEKAALLSAFPAEWGRRARLYWIDGDQIRPQAIEFPGKDTDYTGLVWSPDGRYMAAYDAITGPLPNRFGYVTLIPFIFKIDIYDPEGSLIHRTVMNYAGSSFMWTHCGASPSTPYTPASLLLRNFYIPGFD